MEIHTIMDILQGPFTQREYIPIGRKDGMFYVIQHGKSVEKREKGKRSVLGRLWSLGEGYISVFILTGMHY